MPETPDAKAVVDEFLSRQREVYAGSDLSTVEALLADDVVWHVPGSSPIAGDHRGREAVLAYFRTRRELREGRSGSSRAARRTTRRRSSGWPTAPHRSAAGTSCGAPRACIESRVAGSRRRGWCR